MSDTPTPVGRAAHRALDEETMEAVRRRIGIPVRHSPRAHNEVSSTDSFRHFAESYGDDNPMYCDPVYATASCWGSPIAPPIYPISAGRSKPVEWSDAEKAAMSGGDPLAGIGQYMCGERWLFVEPVRAGDVLWRSQCLSSAELRSSSFGGGTGALVSHRTTWEHDDGAPVALRFLDFWHAERERSRRAGKYRGLVRTVYGEEDLARIDRCYEAESVRGARPLTTTDVKVGDELGPIAKGPLCVTDVIAWHVGNGLGYYGSGALKLGYKNRQRVPRFYVKNDLGFWDAVQRCHWDDAWAQQLGQPAPYDYGAMRGNWMVHLLTNWMGDGAWIWKLSASVRRFNYLGDVHFVSGVVRGVDQSASTVAVDVTGVNQRGEATCDGRAVVILPRPGDTRAVLPGYRPEDVPEVSGP